MRTFVTKVKWNGEKMEIEYTRHGTSTTDELTLASPEAPAPSLTDALVAIKPIALELCELPAEYGEGLRVTGASFTENEKQGFGATITVIKALRKGVLPLNVPHHYVGAESQEGQPGIFDSDQAKALHQLQVEAVAYINGKRAQQGLPLGKDAASMSDEERAEARALHTEAEPTPLARGKPKAEKAPKTKAEKPGKTRRVKSKDDAIEE